MVAFRSGLLVLLIAAASATALAQPAKTAAPAAADLGGPAWPALSAQQRSALAPLARDWASIDGARKAKWLEVASKFQSLPEAERQRVQERMADWARMTPTERGRARLTFQESKQLSPNEKRQRWDAYQALPDDRRRALADRVTPAPGNGARTPQAASAPLNTPAAKRSLLSPARAASAPLVKPVAPTIVQAKPGATTTLMTRPVAPPAHQHPGQPRIAAKPDQVNRNTLLPRNGPQAAAAASAAARP